jgi:hypothetical protein
MPGWYLSTAMTTSSKSFPFHQFLFHLTLYKVAEKRIYEMSLFTTSVFNHVFMLECVQTLQVLFLPFLHSTSVSLIIDTH